MKIVGTVESLWRYPVKSMRGQELPEIFAGFGGVYGDRLFAFRSAAAPAGFPFFTARQQRRMLCCRPRFRHPEKTIAPPALAASQALGSGTTPIYAEPADLMLEVEMPDGKRLAVDDPALVDLLQDGADEPASLTLLRSERALTDCRPLSLISLQTVRQLGRETASELDKRRFRANIYLDLVAEDGFGEDQLVGRSLSIGVRAVISVLQRDSRCMIITLDPETGEKSPAVLKEVAQTHAGKAGVYAAVLCEGMIRQGDAVRIMD